MSACVCICVFVSNYFRSFFNAFDQLNYSFLTVILAPTYPTTGCIKKNEQACKLNISATKYLIFKSFFLLKTEIHTQILNTKPFL